jgi:hypothetical protein
VNDPAPRLNQMVGEPKLAGSIGKGSPPNGPAFIAATPAARHCHAGPKVIQTAFDCLETSVQYGRSSRLRGPDFADAHPRRENGPDETEWEQQPRIAAKPAASPALPGLGPPEDDPRRSDQSDPDGQEQEHEPEWGRDPIRRCGQVERIHDSDFLCLG